MRTPLPPLAAVVLLPIALVSGCGGAKREQPPQALPSSTQLLRTPAPERFGRCREHAPERRALFGELHVHTAYSLDANLEGTRSRPGDVYRFAKGERVGIPPYGEDGRATRSAQIDRPLDFVAVTDHAEFIGFVGACSDPESEAYARRGCKLFRRGGNWAFGLLNMQSAQRGRRLSRHLACGREGEDCDDYYRDLWIDTQNAAEQHLDRTEACRFTTFVGYEYTANPFVHGFEVGNMHRNVIFRSGIVPERPIDYFHTQDLREFWRRLESRCREADTGCDVVVIPHNANLSGGLMFSETAPGASEPYSVQDQQRRADLERLFEIYQHKGASECLPGSPSGDELCDFEITPYDNLRSAKMDGGDDLSEVNFLRYAFGQGLRLTREIGTNPYAYGLVASTDNHLALAGQVHEALFAGGGGAGEAGGGAVFPDRIYFGGGGLAGVWAEENAREAIFRSLRRRETFATSGPRIPVRFFGSWSGYGEGWCEGDDSSRAGAGYGAGVPMGMQLPHRPEGAGAPRFAASAVHDPGTEALPGARLAHMEIIKGTLDSEGALVVTRQVLAGSPQDDAAGLDRGTCESDGRGAGALCAEWEDPAFDPERPAFYYLRAFEVPSCRWTTRICVDQGFDCARETPRPIDVACCDRRLGLHEPECFDPICPAGSDFPCCSPEIVRPVIRERAWSSPIWYVPQGWR